MGEVLTFRPRAEIGTDQVRGDVVPPIPATPQTRQGPGQPLWREVAGRALREARHRREQTLSEVAARAGVSIPYLSEVERGRKEPSSEVLAAVAGALDMTLADLAAATLRLLVPLDLSADRQRTPTQPSAPTRPSGPVALAC